MIPGDIVTLNSDVISNFKQKIYATKGQRVKVISVSDNVIIAGNEQGSRFPVNKSKIEGAIAPEPIKKQPKPIKAQAQKTLFDL